MANVPQQVYYLVQQPANSAPQPNQIVRQNGGRNGPYNGQRRPPQGPRQQQLIPVSGNNMIPVSGNNVIPVPGNNGNANPTNPPVPHPQEGMATVRELAARQNALTGELLQATAPIPPTRPIRQRRASSPTPSTSRVVDPLDPLGLKTLN
ncbi:hypothetical protein GPALN_010150 [Globodera pallida]|nr:hypothetical protein GPALN_010150 [Globodera pallida]